MEVEVEGAKIDLVLFNVMDDIAVDIRKSRKAELFEAIFSLQLCCYQTNFLR